MVIPGVLIVFISMIVGFILSGGNPVHLIVPAEYLTIFGIAGGATVLGTPKKILTIVVKKVMGSLKGGHFSKQLYLDLLVMLFKLFSLARKNGLLALESHISEPEKSDIITKYPHIAHNHLAIGMITETMRLVVDGSVQPEELNPLMESTIETFEVEGHMPLGVLRAIADGLPGIGIIGAVLGIIVTMSHIDAPPAEVGHHVSCALVGTFLGVFAAYGVVSPLISAISLAEAEEIKFLNVIRTAIAAYVTGSSPGVAVEFARRAIFSFDRPSAAELDSACKNSGA
jgi:chemotaxis protein MotA